MGKTRVASLTEQMRYELRTEQAKLAHQSFQQLLNVSAEFDNFLGEVQCKGFGNDDEAIKEIADGLRDAAHYVETRLAQVGAALIEFKMRRKYQEQVLDRLEAVPSITVPRLAGSSKVITYENTKKVGR